MAIPDLSLAFGDGVRATSFAGEATLRMLHLGDLSLSSGRIVACDPFIDATREPFTVAATPGRYPVVATIAHLPSDDRRVAYATLRLSDITPSRWEMAIIAGQDVDTLPESHIFGYPVDAGTGCFMDVDTAQLLDKRLAEDEDYYETLVEAMDRTYVDTWSSAEITLDPESGANAICFSSGFGDGLYASYFGYDSDDRLACLLTDFQVVEAAS